MNPPAGHWNDGHRKLNTTDGSPMKGLVLGKVHNIQTHTPFLRRRGAESLPVWEISHPLKNTCRFNLAPLHVNTCSNPTQTDLSWLRCRPRIPTKKHCLRTRIVRRR